MIRFKCPKCDAMMGSPESMAMQTVKCPTCGALAIVPPAPQAAGSGNDGLRVAPPVSAPQVENLAAELGQSTDPPAMVAPPPRGGYSEPMPRPAYASRQSQSSGVIIMVILFVGILAFVGGLFLGRYQGEHNMKQLLDKTTADAHNQRIELQNKIERLEAKSENPPSEPPR